MRTTLDLDSDILLVGKRLAAERGTSLGRVVSDLARKALEPRSGPKTRNGGPLFKPRRAKARPSLDLVNELRDAR